MKIHGWACGKKSNEREAAVEGDRAGVFVCSGWLVGSYLSLMVMQEVMIYTRDCG